MCLLLARGGSFPWPQKPGSLFFTIGDWGGVTRVSKAIPRGLLKEDPSPPPWDRGFRQRSALPATAEMERYAANHGGASFILRCVAAPLPNNNGLWLKILSEPKELPSKGWHLEGPSLGANGTE